MPDWKKIRAEYIRGGISMRKLAAKHGVSFSSVKRKASAEKWTDLRSQSEIKSTTKIIESVAEREARRVDMFDTIADKLLKQINDGIDDGSIAITGRGWRDITGALKDLREIKGIKSDIDLREQEARIANLRRQAEDDGADREIKIIIGEDAEEFAK